ncbi:MAG TPA: IMP dehydrogenase, partial [Citricoccus sp.]
MEFLTSPTTDLTYSDVFLVPSKSEVTSRMDVDIAADDRTGATIPLVAANMTAVTGRRMVETMARRGGLGILPQDVPIEVIRSVAGWVKDRHPVFETPLRVQPTDTVLDVLHLLGKRNHPAVCVVEADGAFAGIVRQEDCEGVDRFSSVAAVMRQPALSFEASDFPALDGGRMAEPALERAFAALDAAG